MYFETEQEREEFIEWANKKDTEFLSEYPENEDVRCCSKCGRVLRYGSMSYHEGFHFDSCI